MTLPYPVGHEGLSDHGKPPAKPPDPRIQHNTIVEQPAVVRMSNASSVRESQGSLENDMIIHEVDQHADTMSQPNQHPLPESNATNMNIDRAQRDNTQPVDERRIDFKVRFKIRTDNNDPHATVNVANKHRAFINDSLWKTRNKARHGHTQQLSRQLTREQLQRELSAIYEKRHLLSISDQDIFHDSVHQHMDASTAQTRNWLSCYRPLITKSIIESEQASIQGMKTLGTYFRSKKNIRRKRVRTSTRRVQLTKKNATKKLRDCFLSTTWNQLHMPTASRS